MANKKPSKKEIAAAEELVANAQAQLDAATATLGDDDAIELARMELDEATAALAELVEVINPIPAAGGPKVGFVRAIKGVDMWHPFQLRSIPTQGIDDVVIDSWVESQVEAGILEIGK